MNQSLVARQRKQCKEELQQLGEISHGITAKIKIVG